MKRYSAGIFPKWAAKLHVKSYPSCWFCMGLVIWPKQGHMHVNTGIVLCQPMGRKEYQRWSLVTVCPVLNTGVFPRNSKHISFVSWGEKKAKKVRLFLKLMLSVLLSGYINSKWERGRRRKPETAFQQIGMSHPSLLWNWRSYPSLIIMWPLTVALPLHCLSVGERVRRCWPPTYKATFLCRNSGWILRGIHVSRGSA